LKKGLTFYNIISTIPCTACDSITYPELKFVIAYIRTFSLTMYDLLKTMDYLTKELKPVLFGYVPVKKS
jgi:hypothetical protein